MTPKDYIHLRKFATHEEINAMVHTSRYELVYEQENDGYQLCREAGLTHEEAMDIGKLTYSALQDYIELRVKHKLFALTAFEFAQSEHHHFLTTMFKAGVSVLNILTFAHAGLGDRKRQLIRRLWCNDLNEGVVTDNVWPRATVAETVACILAGIREADYVWARSSGLAHDQILNFFTGANE